MREEYEEATNWIQRVDVQVGENGNAITILYNEYQTVAYVFTHDSHFEAAKNSFNDVKRAIDAFLETN